MLPASDSPSVDSSRSTVARQPNATREAVVDLLGLIGCGELFAFETLARDCALADSLEAKSALGGMADARFQAFTLVSERITESGADPNSAIGAYIPTLTEFHRKTAPHDLPEGLMKAYVGGGISSDFGREVAEYVDQDTRGFVREVLVDQGEADFVISQVQRALRHEPALAGRLALWGRRLMGEALAQAQRVAADRTDLARLVVGVPQKRGAGLVEFTRMLARLTERHSERMRRLGLEP